METSAVRQQPTGSNAPAESSTTERRCPAPANFQAEVARYDREAQVRTWVGPRYRMTYRVLGQGPPLILVPDLSASHRVYALLLNRLSERFQTISYEYPGDQTNDGARLGRIRHEHLAEDLLGLVDHLEISEPSVVGVSFGSTVVLRALALRSGTFPRTAIQGAFAHRSFTAAERSAAAIGRRLPQGIPARSVPWYSKILEYNHKSHFSRLIEDRWKFYLEETGQTSLRALSHRASLLQGLDLRPILERISSEVLIFRGNEDRLVSRQLHEELIRRVPHVRTVIMPNVGHQPHLTHAEALAEALAQWFLQCEAHSHACETSEPGAGCGGDPRNCLGGSHGGCGGSEAERSSEG